jgi:uncharacterized protein YacL
MAWFILARLLFTAAVIYTAFLLRPLDADRSVNIAFGAALAGVAVFFEWRLRDLALTNLLGAIVGGAFGLLLAKGIGAALFWADSTDERVQFLHGFVLLALPYLGLVIGGRKGEWLEPPRLLGLFRAAGPQRRYKILDTSVIIDGRVADLCETGFMDGTLVIPQFVLKELQLVADSADSMKRNRGRRGLDILQKIQKMAGVDVTISDADYPEVREVDLKLIELARTLQGKIVTNDFNLNKVAQLRGVEVLNINELANALKPVVLPGEIMKVFILKEGKEYNQGVAYLDDGTMVVVDNARKMISKTIDIVVTSVLQTTAGKMIFGRYIDPTAAAQSGQTPAVTADDARKPRPVAAPTSRVSAAGGGSLAPAVQTPQNGVK